MDSPLPEVSTLLFSESAKRPNSATPTRRKPTAWAAVPVPQRTINEPTTLCGTGSVFGSTASPFITAVKTTSRARLKHAGRLVPDDVPVPAVNLHHALA